MSHSDADNIGNTQAPTNWHPNATGRKYNTVNANDTMHKQKSLPKSFVTEVRCATKNETSQLTQDCVNFFKQKMEPNIKENPVIFNDRVNQMNKAKCVNQHVTVNNEAASDDIISHSIGMAETFGKMDIKMLKQERITECDVTKPDAKQPCIATKIVDIMCIASQTSTNAVSNIELKIPKIMKGLCPANCTKKKSRQFKQCMAKRICDEHFPHAVFIDQYGKKTPSRETSNKTKFDNEYSDNCKWIGQCIIYALCSGGLPYIFITDTNVAIVLKIEPTELTQNQNKCKIKITIFPMFFLTNMDTKEMMQYMSDNYLENTNEERIIWTNDDKLKNIRTPLAALIGTLFELNQKHKLNGKKYHICEKKASNKNDKTKRKPGTKARSIKDYWENTPNISLCFDEKKHQYHLRHDSQGYVMCLPIKELNNQLYWFKTDWHDMNALKQEYETMNELKQIDFMKPYIVSDYHFAIDDNNMPFLMTKDEGTRLDVLFENGKITNRKYDMLQNKMAELIDKLSFLHNYKYPDFADRNILFNTKTNKVTLIDFESLGRKSSSSYSQMSTSSESIDT